MEWWELVGAVLGGILLVWLSLIVALAVVARRRGSGIALFEWRTTSSWLRSCFVSPFVVRGRVRSRGTGPGRCRDWWRFTLSADCGGARSIEQVRKGGAALSISASTIIVVAGSHA